MLKKADITEYIEIISRLLMFAHKYYKDKEDSSSVSLRDVTRFIILF